VLQDHFDDVLTAEFGIDRDVVERAVRSFFAEIMADAGGALQEKTRRLEDGGASKQ
jgi:hypothetical protein